LGLVIIRTLQFRSYHFQRCVFIGTKGIIAQQ